MQYLDNHCRDRVKDLFDGRVKDLFDYVQGNIICLFIPIFNKYDQVSPLLYNVFHYDEYTISTT